MVMISRSRSVLECVSVQDKISLEYILHDIPQSGVIEDLIGGWIRDLADLLAEEAERQFAIGDDRGVDVIVSRIMVVMIRAYCIVHPYIGTKNICV